MAVVAGSVEGAEEVAPGSCAARFEEPHTLVGVLREVVRLFVELSKDMSEEVLLR